MSQPMANGREFRVDRRQLAAAADHDDEIVALAMRTLYRHRYGEDPSP